MVLENVRKREKWRKIQREKTGTNLKKKEREFVTFKTRLINDTLVVKICGNSFNNNYKIESDINDKNR